MDSVSVHYLLDLGASPEETGLIVEWGIMSRYLVIEIMKIMYIHLSLCRYGLAW